MPKTAAFYDHALAEKMENMFRRTENCEDHLGRLETPGVPTRLSELCSDMEPYTDGQRMNENLADLLIWLSCGTFAFRLYLPTLILNRTSHPGQASRLRDTLTGIGCAPLARGLCDLGLSSEAQG